MYILVPKHYDFNAPYAGGDGLSCKDVVHILHTVRYVHFWWVCLRSPRPQGGYAATDPVRVPAFLVEQGLTVDLSKNGLMIRYVDKPSYAQCLTAVRQNGLALQYVDAPSEELCFEAYRQNKRAIQFVHNPSRMLQFAMVSQNTWCLQRFEQPSEELCRMAIKKLPSSIRYLRNPSPALCMLAVRMNGGVLKYIPEHLRTEEMVFAALMKHGSALKCIRQPTETMILHALTQDGTALKHVKQPTYAQLTRAVQQNGLALQFVPSERQTPHLCVTACYSNPRAERYITLFQLE
jgi:protein tyrosine phosphatase (PTP) superfamily phosphohydrolase (DUF442 family)